MVPLQCAARGRRHAEERRGRSPPVWNVALPRTVISTVSLAAKYETVKFVIGCRIVSFFFLTLLMVMVSSW